MPVRLATRADLGIMAQVNAAAFGPDPLFQLFFPYKDKYPDEFVRATSENLLVQYWDYRLIHMVSYELREDLQHSHDERSSLLPTSTGKRRQREVITGMASWERVGKGWEKLHGLWGWWDPRRLVKSILSMFFTIRGRIFLNKAEAHPSSNDPDALTIRNFITRIAPFSEHLYSAPHRQVRWGLEVLAISPEHQGRGFGSELVKDGLERAKHDPEGDLPVVVVAAGGREGFYQKNGFGDIEGYTAKEGGKDNPLCRAGIEGGAIMWTK